MKNDSNQGEPTKSRTAGEPYRIGILVSGRGSNMEALLRGVREGRWPLLDPALVLSDRADAPALKTAETLGVPAHYLDPGPYRTKMEVAREAAFVDALRRASVRAVVLAGFMRIVKGPLLDAFAPRVFNIHPSLLPKYPGLDVQRRALEAGESESGCTVHLVDAGVDSGRILAQARVPVIAGDTAATLAARILVEEHRLYGETLQAAAEGRFGAELL